MRTLNYSNIAETLYYKQLANGLRVFILHKKDFQKTYATFTTEYGSIDSSFVVNGNNYEVPDGIAHFLEHKMFEEEKGDVFQDFAKLGGQTNAFTTFNRTTYLFSSTENVRENLEVLLNFVQNPYFTDENVNKEKGIIAQEIKMYQDNPDWRLYFGLLGLMYQESPISKDIAGTVESIQRITKEDLSLCYNTFYHPSNMVLFIVSSWDPIELLAVVENNQTPKKFTSSPDISRNHHHSMQLLTKKKEKTIEIKLAVAIPKLLIGFSDPETGLTGDQYLERELSTLIMLELIFGKGSKVFTELLEAGLIDNDFSFEYQLEKQYGFSTLGGSSKKQVQLLGRIKAELNKAKEDGFDTQMFERVKKKKIGEYLRRLNYPEYIANQFTKYVFNDANLFDMLKVLEEIKLKDINDRLEQFTDFSAVIVNKA